ncbi:MAG: hypothetical protein HN757_06945 [Calditrichaeota bacterium]|nr:hypothetical protein [Calditrichota bacterium]
MKSPDCRARRILFAIYLSMVMLISSTDLLVASPDAPREATLGFLRFSPSTQANAMGKTYASTFHNSPMASILHPASLGLFARENQFGYSFYEENIDWLPVFNMDEIWFDASSVAFGINLKDNFDIPVSVGLGFHEVYLNLGEIEGSDEFDNPTGVFSSWEKNNGTTISVALDYFLRVSYGYTLKKVESHRSVDLGGWPEMGVGDAKVNAYDYGFIVEMPVVSLLEKVDLKIPRVLPNTKFYFDPGLFYSKTNVGRRVYFVDPTKANPIPRTVSLGINLKTGLTYRTKFGEINLLAFNWSRELDELLVKRDKNGYTQYTSGLNDLQFWKNLINGKANGKIDASKKGWEINFADCYYLRRGIFEDIEGKIILNTKGWGVNYIQIIKTSLMAYSDEIDWLLFWLNRVDFEQHYAEYEAGPGHPLDDTKFSSFVIRFRLN